MVSVTLKPLSTHKLSITLLKTKENCDVKTEEKCQSSQLENFDNNYL